MRRAYDGRSQEIDWGLMAKTALVSFAAALGVSGGTNVVMLITGNDLIKKHRPTLTFRSAIFGDGVILPFINCLMMNAFKLWKPRLSAQTALVPVVGGSAISLMFHIAQGKGGMVNWTMTKPWRWNLLGYYHFVYMATQFSYMLLYFTQLAGHWKEGEITDTQKRDLALIAANLAAFGILLYTDYY
ncbi:MAG TPA: hypothetical protein VEW94_11990 [Chloroflexia bacterium]|nr:hypothetical protein [Chloroflexia bacterium]